ncbi:protein kinase domain-containing protein [Archangium sp.]|uniref:serine/threonine-protein kinase n=1 Tax=Archangium sp. TaxID=1872627 RepID=UPI00286C609E|nr:protein kinase [Archangium sp.]
MRTSEVGRGQGRLPLALRRLLWKRAEREAAAGAGLPPLGTEVGGYLLEARLGRGGFGVVYRARCGGAQYAVKLISARHAGTWGRGELAALLRVESEGIAPLLGHGYWPPAAPRFLFLVTRYVRGRTVSAWAREDNPHALGVTERVLGLTRALGEVHAAGVVHRDVKGTNAMVHEPGGGVVLVDFGSAGPEGVCTRRLPPGTPHYRSPEALRFLREGGRGEGYRATHQDDLWALGVLLYWLLTGSWPFDPAEPEAALHEPPEPPHERNPRVPRALSEVCRRLLAPRPEARFSDARAVGAALEAARAGADARWEVPLCESYGPNTVTTLGEVQLDEEAGLARSERLAGYEERHPVRGQPSPPEEAATPARPTRSAPPEEDGPEPAESRGARAPREQGVSRGPGVLQASLALGALVALVVALLPLRAPVRSTPPERLSGVVPVTPVMSGQEVAGRGWSLKSGGDAVPEGWAFTPASAAFAAFLEQDTRMKKTLMGVGCTVLAACTTPDAQVRAEPAPAAKVRPLPPPAECPEGAVETMTNTFGIYIGQRTSATTDVDMTRHVGLRPVREGEVTFRLGIELGRLPQRTLLKGRLFVRDRVYGRFTEARTPDGQVFPICLELIDANDFFVGLQKRHQKGSDTPMVFSELDVRAVDRFE